MSTFALQISTSRTSALYKISSQNKPTCCPIPTGQAAGSTTCGMLLKVLVKTPVFVDGSHVVLLTPLPGGAASNAARSLFGSTGGLASLRSKFYSNILRPLLMLKDSLHNCGFQLYT